MAFIIQFNTEWWSQYEQRHLCKSTNYIYQYTAKKQFHYIFSKDVNLNFCIFVKLLNCHQSTLHSCDFTCWWSVLNRRNYKVISMLVAAASNQKHLVFWLLWLVLERVETSSHLNETLWSRQLSRLVWQFT